MMPTEAENRTQDACLEFVRDENNDIQISAILLDDELANVIRLGAFPVRDLLIAIHAVQIDPVVRRADPLPVQPAAPARRRRWWER